MSITIQQVRSDHIVSKRDIDGAIRPFISVTIINSQDENSVYMSAIEAKIKERETDQWTTALLFGTSSTEIRFNDVEVGTEYNIRIKPIYSNGAIGTWAESWGDPVTDYVLVEGNRSIPPDPLGFTVKETISGNLLFRVTLDWIPADLAGFEMRYFEGSTTDWDAMTWHAVFYQPYESSAFASGHYTFAVKTLNVARDMHEDPLAVPPTPKLYNSSANAFFVEVDVVDSRPVSAFLFNATTPTSIDGTITTLANYGGAGVSDNAQTLGVSIDAILGTITFPATLSDSLYAINGKINLDVSGAGNPANDTNIGVYLRSSVSGDKAIGGAYLVDRHKQTLLPIILVDLDVVVAAGETLSIGIATVGGGSGNVAIDSSLFEAKYVGAWSG